MSIVGHGSIHATIREKILSEIKQWYFLVITSKYKHFHNCFVCWKKEVINYIKTTTYNYAVLISENLFDVLLLC